MALANVVAARHLGDLAQHYARSRRASQSPFDPEVVLVPNSFTSGWLERFLANPDRPGSAGVVAHLSTIYWSRLLGAVLYEDPADYERWSASSLGMRIFEVSQAATPLTLAASFDRGRRLAKLIAYRGDDVDELLQRHLVDDDLESVVVNQIVNDGVLPPAQQFIRHGVRIPDLVAGGITFFSCLESPLGAVTPRVVAELSRSVDVSLYLLAPFRECVEGWTMTGGLHQRFSERAGELVNLWREGLGEEPRWIGDDDAGMSARVTLHTTVGRARQVEVARDVVLADLAAQGALAHEARLLATDAAHIAPLVAMYFEPGPSATPAPRLAVEFGDSRMSRPSRRLDALIALLRVLTSDLTLLDVETLLAQTPIRAGLGLNAESSQRVRELAREGYVTLGIDASSRAHLGVYEVDDDGGTWQRFIDRVALASVYDSASGGGDSISPLGVPDDLEWVTRLHALMAVIKSGCEVVAHRQPLAEWGPFLLELERVISRDPDVRDPGLDQVMGYLEVVLSDSSALLSFDDLRSLVEIGATQMGGPNLLDRGGVHFGDPVALAPATYRITAVLGLDEELMPFNDTTGSFDDVRPGDPDVRSQFRLALITVLATTSDHVHLFASDRNVHDGTRVELAVMVEELCDALSLSVVRHPRHGFSTMSVGEAASSTFDPAHERLAHVLSDQSRRPPEANLPIAPSTRFAPGRTQAGVTLEALRRFFHAPQSTFARDVIAGAHGPRTRRELRGVPILDVGDQLDLHIVKQELLDRFLREGVDEVRIPRDSPVGAVAPGMREISAEEATLELVRDFARMWRRDRQLVPLRPHPKGERIGAIEVEGRTVSRQPIDLWRSSRQSVVISLTPSTTFRGGLWRIALDCAFATVELGEAVCGYLSRPLTKEEVSRREPSAGEVHYAHPCLRISWVDGETSAAEFLARTVKIYERRLSGPPNFFSQTSLAHLGIKALGLKSPTDTWRRRGGGRGEFFGESVSDPIVHLMYPEISYEELMEIGDGVMGRGQREVAELAELFRIDDNFTSAPREWTALLGGEQ